jgi:chemotaxis protein MotB
MFSSNIAFFIIRTISRDVSHIIFAEHMKKIFYLAVLIPLIGTGCVSKKKFNEQVAKYDELSQLYDRLALELKNCQDQNAQKTDRIRTLEEDIEALKANSNAMLNQLADLAVITKEQAESIRKSMENINAKEVYIRDLQRSMAYKDSLNLALIMNLKRALIDVDDSDIEVKVDGSAVFISISDKLLFRSGSYQITPKAKEVLGKVARVIKAQPDIQFMVEGHTDNKPIKTSFIQDNWDLSVLRATAVVRSLQQDFQVEPSRMVAAGKGEYTPIASNDTDANRQINRRTRIVILPQLDQFFKLIEGN